MIVVNADHVVLGRIDQDRDAHDDRLAEEVMRPGPTTVRANEPLDPLLVRM